MSSNDARSPERLVFFSDAVAAIALTLLVLPLADAAPEAADKYSHSFEVITANQAKIYSFLLSFYVIAQMWLAHHRLFEQVKAYNHRLMLANFCWLLTIVVVPFPTEMIGQFNNDRFTAAFYIGTVLAANVCLFAMMLIIRADPALAKNGEGRPNRPLFMQGVTTGILVVALVLAATVPGATYFPLLLLLPTYPIARIRSRRTADTPA
jgi:uncharacterized membrane protein